MKFMFLVRTPKDAAPTPALMEAMHKLAQEEVAAGRLVADGGLMPKDAGKELRLEGGKLIMMDGPFAETKEVIGGFAIFELPDMDAAIESGRRFLALHSEHAPRWEGTLEIRQLAGSQVEMLRSGGA